MRRKSFPPLLLALALLVPNFLAASDPVWIEVKSQHFRVITNAGEKNGREVAQRFEQMRSAFALIFGRKTLNEPVPLTIIGFRSTKELRQYSPLYQGKIVEVAGFFLPGADENFVAIDMSREGSWETVKHEYAHALLDANYKATAPWFDEGFAEFFSSLKLTDDDAQLGEAIPEAALLLQGRKLGLQELFETQHHSDTYNRNGQRRDMFYVQSWLVVHYLFDTQQVPKASRYFGLVNNDKTPVASAVQTAFGITVPELDKAVLDYLRANKVKVRLFSLKEQMAVSRDVVVRPLDPLEVRASLADLHLHSPDYGTTAVKEYEAILAQNSGLADAQRGLGYAYLQQHDYSKAGEHLQAAAQLGSKDPKVYFYTAVMMQEKDRSALTSPELIRNLRRAIELDPQYADAFGMLGLALLNSRSYPESEEILAKAVALAPRDDMYRLNYGIVLLNQQKVAEARSSLAMVAHSSDPMVVERASQMLQEISDRENRSVSQAAAMATDRDDREPSADVPLTARRSAPEPLPPIETPPAAPTAPVKISYVQGMLVHVDCSAAPAAVLTVTAGGKSWKMTIADTAHAIVIGADKFSCAWSQKKVALNYSPTAANEGKVVSLELQ
jgi:tetratricopeptide (TPR) repeat protein